MSRENSCDIVSVLLIDHDDEITIRERNRKGKLVCAAYLITFVCVLDHPVLTPAKRYNRLVQWRRWGGAGMIIILPEIIIFLFR